MRSTRTGWIGLIVGDWTTGDDARSCARRAVRAGRALGLRTLAVSTDERCLARLAADGWSMRPASSADPLGLATALTPAGSIEVPPALLLGDGATLPHTTARVAALLGGRIPDPDAVARCAAVVTRQRVAAQARRSQTPSRRYVVQVQDGAVVGIVEDVTAGGHRRDYDCPGTAADRRVARLLRARTLAVLNTAGVTSGPAEVTARVDDDGGVSVMDVAPGRIDACVASVIELATGRDPIMAAVLAAATAAARPRRLRAIRRATRHASLRRADLRT
ncbi:MAG TPA: hypothetical protein VFT95_03150, partial [Micromonosporaceae bacterium]|nr:hypothetical protein [Micromonosporaceae bacterium]